MALATKVNMLEKFDKVLACLKFALDSGKDAAQVGIVRNGFPSVQSHANIGNSCTLHHK